MTPNFVTSRSIATRCALVLIASFATAACSDYNAPITQPTRTLTTVDVTLESASIEVGQFSTASAVALDQYAEPITASTITFSSSNPEVAAVSPTTGKIFAISPGTAFITATIDGRSGQRTIAVAKAPTVRINEIKSNGDAPGGWVEFFNATNVPVDLSGWTLTDGSVFHSVVLPSGTTVPAGGFLVLDESVFPVGLGASDGIHLFSRYGVLVDGFFWTDNVATSYGRCPDGTGDFGTTTVVTKGAPNSCATALAR